MLEGPTGVGRALADRFEFEEMAERWGDAIDTETLQIQSLYKQLQADEREALEHFAQTMIDKRDEQTVSES